MKCLSAGNTFLEHIFEGDPLPGDGYVLHFSFGLHESDTFQIILLYP